MPYKTVKIPGGVKVVNADTGKVMAKKTTPTKAKAQIRFLMSLKK
jgi:hypothetical protein